MVLRGAVFPYRCDYFEVTMGKYHEVPALGLKVFSAFANKIFIFSGALLLGLFAVTLFNRNLSWWLVGSQTRIFKAFPLNSRE